MHFTYDDLIDIKMIENIFVSGIQMFVPKIEQPHFLLTWFTLCRFKFMRLLYCAKGNSPTPFYFTALIFLTFHTLSKYMWKIIGLLFIHPWKIFAALWHWGVGSGRRDRRCEYFDIFSCSRITMSTPLTGTLEFESKQFGNLLDNTRSSWIWLSRWQ